MAATKKTEGRKCEVCKGKGKCRACRGRGIVITHSGMPANRCLDCHGTGECAACNGKGISEE